MYLETSKSIWNVTRELNWSIAIIASPWLWTSATLILKMTNSSMRSGCQYLHSDRVVVNLLTALSPYISACPLFRISCTFWADCSGSTSHPTRYTAQGSSSHRLAQILFHSFLVPRAIHKISIIYAIITILIIWFAFVFLIFRTELCFLGFYVFNSFVLEKCSIVTSHKWLVFYRIWAELRLSKIC